MTILTLLAGFTLGTAATASVAVPVHLRIERGWRDEHGWRADVPDSTGVVPVDPQVVRRLARQADSAERRAARWERTVTAFQQAKDFVVADLLDSVQARDEQIDQLQSRLDRRQRSPIPDYGGRARRIA